MFVLTHAAPGDPPDGGVYRFVTDGVESALDRARAAAGDRIVCIMGGANVGQQFLTAGLVDEISVHLVPVLFGAGTRMFDHLGLRHRQLEALEAVATPTAIHTRFRVIPE
ncbi:dihydrofolate reductase family protein [Microlunatus ginsengisoli]|uniref:dihydrofolate reductase family protein n=1 Tax=Microlunatus ginsengisoli TaxID=363863 RepID=UPI0031CDF4B9